MARQLVQDLQERVSVVSACRDVDEVIPAAPLVVDGGFLEAHRIALVAHGDDLSSEAAATVCGAAVDRGILRLG